MRISWNWLGEFVDLSNVKGPKALAELLTSRGLEVEAVESQAQGFDKVVTAQILEKKPHPQADRLSLCQVKFGPEEPQEIVCGAQNMKAGDKVALAQIGAHLPNGIKIEKSKIRGVVSNGMLCSLSELKLAEESEGIMILPVDTPIGIPLAQVLGRNDTILTLKLTANRGDCLSHLGIAREVAAALGLEVKAAPKIHSLPTTKSPISIHLQAQDLAPQFHGVYIKGVKIGPSPEKVVRRLESLGHRSINNVVDASNLVMLEMGHPTHAYDATQIKGGKITVRKAKAGEKLPLLDGDTVELQGFELVIADEQRAVGLAGVMGGGNSEVQPQTHDIFLECAEFDPISVRKASTRFQKKTDAAHRFERGIDPSGLTEVMGRLVYLIQEMAGGEVVGAEFARTAARLPESPVWKRKIRFSKNYLNEFLGFQTSASPLTEQKIRAILAGLGCEVEAEHEAWVVHPPHHRWDLNLKEDIAEEVARSLGYDQIPSTLPPLSGSPIFPGSATGMMSVMDRARNSLRTSGLYETVNFAFMSAKWLEKFGLKSSAQILNPLSEEYQSLVPSLLPGLVHNALDNWNHHFGSDPLAIRLFEFRPVFGAAGKIEAQAQTETGVVETWKLAGVVSGPRFQEALRNEKGEVDFFDLRAMIDHLLTALGTKGARYVPFNDANTKEFSYFHPGQSAILMAGNKVAGAIGLLHPALAQDFKARLPLWMFELDWAALAGLSRKASEVPSFRAWPDFPGMERDFALVVKNDVTAEKICQIAVKAGKPVAKSAKVFDIYRGAQVAEGMTSVAVRVIFYEEGRSLQESEAEAASARIVESWKKELGIELRS